MKRKRRIEDYPFRVDPLAASDGGGYLVTFADLPGCMADGETVASALADARKAFSAWQAAQLSAGRPMPEPGKGGESVKFVARLPGALHAELNTAAAQDGVSMNTELLLLVQSALASRRQGARGPTRR